MTNTDADRDLLFGLLALQFDFVTREQLVAAMKARAQGRAESLRLFFVEQGALTPERRDLLDPLVAEHVRGHGGDARCSLAVISTLTPAPAIPGPSDAPDDPGPQAVVSTLSGAGWAPVTVAPESGPTGQLGQQFGHRFRILRPLARGGLGQVSVAIDEEVGREVALKEILPDYVHSRDARSRFLHEAEINGKLEHPGIVPVYGLGAHEDGRPYYAMRFIQGDSLLDAVRAYHDLADSLDPSERVLGLRGLIGRLIDACNAVAYAHSKGVLHRDLTPRNIMLGDYGETLIIDWGLAKAGHEVGRPDGAGPATAQIVPSPVAGRVVTGDGTALGTPGYMSPEAALGRIDLLGPATDVYSLGAVLLTILTGQPPVPGPLHEVLGRTIAGEIPSPREVAPATPAALDAIVRKAMAPRPEDRYAGPRGLADDLGRFLADEPIAHYREPWAGRARRWAKRHRTLVTSTAAALVVATLGLAGSAGVLEVKNRQLDGKNLALDRVNDELKGRNQQLDDQYAELDRANGELEARYRDLLAANEATRAAEALADARLDKAMDAIYGYYRGFVEGDEGSEALPKGLQERLLARPRQFYEELTRELAAKETPSRRELELLAEGRRNLASVLFYIGRAPDSISESEQAIDLCKRLVDADPDNRVYHAKLASAYDTFATAQWMMKDLDAATRAGREAVDTLRLLVDKDPGDVALRSSLAMSWANLANYLRPTDAAGALTANRESLALTAALADEHPDKEDYQKSLAHAEHHMALSLVGQGERAEAEELMRRAIGRLDRLARARPEDHVRRYDLAMSEYALGDVILDPKAGRARREALGSAISRLEVLVAEQPMRTFYRFKLAACLAKDGEILRADGDDEESLAIMEKAVTVLEPLAEALPDETHHRANLARYNGGLGFARMNCKDPEGARQAWAKSLSLYDTLIRQQPDEAEHAKRRATVADAMAMSGDDGRSAAYAYDRQVARIQGLITGHPEQREHRAQLARVHIDRGGQCLRHAGQDPAQAAAAQAAFGQALAIAEALVREATEDVRYASILAATLNGLAIIDLNNDRARQARDALVRAVAIQERALEAEPANPMYRNFLANHLKTLIHVSVMLDDKQAFAKASRRLKELE